MQSYIRYQETEQLLKIYPNLQAMTESIKLQMSSLESAEVTDDDILGMALPHTNFDGVPSFSKGTTSDRTAKVALSYGSSMSHEEKEALQELQAELQLIEVIIAKLEISLGVLSPIQKEIVVLRYCKGLKWDAIEYIVNKDNYLMSVSAMKSRCKEGVERITIVCRITLSEYAGIMKLFNHGNGGE
jgi:hypothetical protein